MGDPIRRTPVKTEHGEALRLLAFVRGPAPPQRLDADVDEEPVWPNLVFRELLAALTLGAVIWILSLAIDAPLEERANPGITPNPAKAPWYFVGLQELLRYFDPWIAGVMIPTTIIAGLVAIPYLDRNPSGVGRYRSRGRPFASWVFLSGVGLWFLLILIGEVFRGPSQAWYWPWESWSVAKAPVTANRALPLPAGILALSAWFGLGALTLARLARGLRRSLGGARFAVLSTLMLLMLAVPTKIVLSICFGLKYILVTPWFRI